MRHVGDYVSGCFMYTLTVSFFKLLIHNCSLRVVKIT